ncbi:uncharacterized protein FOMMEDRAFT_148866 [Fomitiporia mediterranea MF3/22]|uniref:uncharacterized protein n=1 Tax=Fomitiporia mediterranea (strain MF3/22) TaxID=694068 RepID=UPI0004407699|nr:uncharacterized protein FOMMEDRAFT_148866 [Fomitiporia mediterranea MF3/22]EJC98846.1 hypothetical protein FOMMEDRAFT_148866 [Fomitiporia mediterranea MF3/22]
METPPRERPKDSRPRLSSDEKKQLLANLDLEVQHRARQFEETLAQVLENFKNHHEGQVLRVPKLVRGITMAEFADKYNGDINACLRGLQRERQGGEPTLDPASKKRKWKDTDEQPGPEDAESSRAPKTARFGSPVKMNAANIIKSRLNKTPSTQRTPRRLYPPLGPNSPSKLPSTRPQSRFMSPTKASASRTASASTTASRVPSSSNFNPAIPKTPAYPRLPRKNENIMSVNGSPLVLPGNRERDREKDKGGVVDTIDEGEEGEVEPHVRQQQTIKRQKSITIRRDPTFAMNGDGVGMPRSRSPSRAAHSSSGSSTSTSTSSSLPSIESNQPSAFMRVPTKDGLVLEFDPLLTTPAELDALEGITESAKKQAREDMTRLVQAALSRWKI